MAERRSAATSRSCRPGRGGHRGPGREGSCDERDGVEPLRIVDAPVRTSSAISASVPAVTTSLAGMPSTTSVQPLSSLGRSGMACRRASIRARTRPSCRRLDRPDADLLRWAEAQGDPEFAISHRLVEQAGKIGRRSRCRSAPGVLGDFDGDGLCGLARGRRTQDADIGVARSLRCVAAVDARLEITSHVMPALMPAGHRASAVPAVRRAERRAIRLEATTLSGMGSAVGRGGSRR